MAVKTYLYRPRLSQNLLSRLVPSAVVTQDTVAGLAFPVSIEEADRPALDEAMEAHGWEFIEEDTGGFRFDMGSWLYADQVGIDPPHAALRSPSDVQALADFLDPIWRPWTNAPGIVGNTIHVQTTGDDETGDGTSANPFATVARAVQLIGLGNGNHVNIQLGAGTFSLPRLVYGWNFVRVRGHEVVEFQTVVQAVVTNTEEALTVDVTHGSMNVAQDELVGRCVIFGANLNASTRGWIRSNEATVGGVTRLTLSQANPTSQISPGVGTQIRIIDQQTTLTAPYVILGSVACVFQRCVIEGGPTFVLSSDKVEYLESKLTQQSLRISRGAGVNLTTCYCLLTGHVDGLSKHPMIRANRDSDLTVVWGTVIDGAAARLVDNDVASVSAMFSGQIITQGNCVFTRLGARGVTFDSGDCGVELFTASFNSHQVWVFDDCEAGIQVNSERGVGGSLRLPNLVGEVTADYVVTAQRGAYVMIGNGNSMVVSATGVNRVSADGGASNVAQHMDGTIIYGGSPAPAGFAPKGQELYFSMSGPTVPRSFVGLIWVNQTGRDLTFARATLWQRLAGTTGSTVVDVLMDDGSGWVSLWSADPSQRPTLTPGSGDDAMTDGGPPDFDIIPPNAKLRMDVVSAQAGGAEDLLLQLWVR